jgi:membrane fusion protein, copper/silver efflux system
MHPTVLRDRQGACPVCGMDLVKKLNDSGAGHDPAELAKLGRVSINPTKRVLGNVAVSRVEAKRLERSFRAPAQIVHDEEGLETISAWIGGRIERLYVEETGTRVKKGQKLLTIYSPALVTAQEEFLAAVRGGEFTRGLRDQAARKLRLWGMSRGQIARVERKGKVIERVLVFAPADGTVTERMVRQGQYVKEGQALLSLSTLSRVWLEANVYEKDIALVDEGAMIDFSVASLPGRTFAGKIELMHPVLDRQTRTMRVRASFANPRGELRPGMYAVAAFRAPVTVAAAPVVPVTAVVRTGRRSVVYVEVEDGIFEQREIQVGHRAANSFVVLSGLKPGELVVSSGGFLVDSEAQLMAGAYGPASQPTTAPASMPDSGPDGAPATEASSGSAPDTASPPGSNERPPGDSAEPAAVTPGGAAQTKPGGAHSGHGSGAKSPATGAKSKPATGAKSKPASGAKSKPASGAKSKPASGAKSKPASGAKSKPASGAQSKPASGAKSKPADGAKSKPKPATGAKSNPARGEPASGKANAAGSVKSKAAEDAKSKPDDGPKSKPADGPKSKPATSPKSKPASGAKSKPASGSSSKPGDDAAAGKETK